MTARALITLAGLAGGVLAIAPLAHAQTTPVTGWTQTFAEEFEGGSVDLSKWNVRNAPGQFNNELQLYTPSAVTVANNRLTIKSDRCSNCSRSYTSGLIETLGKFGQQYGRFEMRAKLPGTQGLWPAFWLLPTSTGWPPEIDIMELKGQQPTQMYVTNHWGVYPTSYQYFSTPLPGPVNYTTTYNTFAVEWDPGRLEFYVNGAKRATHTSGVPAEPFYIILNTAVGGDFLGNPDASTVFPQFMDVLWVRAYRRTVFNSTFENRGPSGSSPLDGWTGFGNRFADTSFPRTGTTAAKLFGPFAAGGGTSGIYQDTTVKPGQLWRASAWWFTPTSDRMRGPNTTSTRIEWRNAAGTLISTLTGPGLTADSPPDVYTRSMLEGVAPAGATTARFLLLFTQPGADAGAAFIDDVDLQPGMANTGFEDVAPGTPPTPRDWTVTGSVSAVTSTAAARSGSTGARIARTGTTGVSVTTAYEELPARPGQIGRFTTWWKNPSTEPLAGGASTQARVEWLDSQRRSLGLLSVPVLNASSPQDVWRQALVQTTAPAGTVWVRTFVQAVHTGSDSGAAYIDDAMFSVLASNTGFEDLGPGEDTPLYDWVPFGGATTASAPVRTGNSAARLGNLATVSPVGAYQDFIVNPGERWRASAWLAHTAGDPLTGSASGSVNIEWRDAAGRLISFIAAPPITSAAPTGVYQQAVIDGIAPPNAVRGRLVFIGQRSGAAGSGTVYVDDVDLARLGPCGEIIAPDSPVCRANFDCTGTVDVADIFAFLGAWFALDQRADADNNGTVEVADIFVFLSLWFAGC